MVGIWLIYLIDVNLSGAAGRRYIYYMKRIHEMLKMESAFINHVCGKYTNKLSHERVTNIH